MRGGICKSKGSINFLIKKNPDIYIYICIGIYEGGKFC